MRRLVPILALLAVTVALGTGVAMAGDGPLPPELRAVRAAVARYHSVEQAIADGYVRQSPCESTPAGAMGHHFVNRSLMGPGLDPLRPEILLYVPDQNGSLKFVGVEYWAADADQNLATDGDRPFLFGRGFNGPMPGHTPQMPIHYDLHVWVAEHNAAGVFTTWNPALSCP